MVRAQRQHARRIAAEEVIPESAARRGGWDGSPRTSTRSRKASRSFIVSASASRRYLTPEEWRLNERADELKAKDLSPPLRLQDPGGDALERLPAG